MERTKLTSGQIENYIKKFSTEFFPVTSLNELISANDLLFVDDIQVIMSSEFSENLNDVNQSVRSVLDKHNISYLNYSFPVLFALHKIYNF